MKLRDTPIRQPGRSPSKRGLLIALLALWAAGCDFPGRPKSSDRYVAPQQETRFEVLFQKNCIGCHGAKGELGPAPPLSDKLFLALIPDTELKRVIAEGRSGTLMPAFAKANGGQLTAEQVTILADGIKPRWGSGKPAPSGAPPYRIAEAQPGGLELVDVAAGRKVFARACADCHGDRGEGGGSAGAINAPDFLALISDQALRRYVITGRPDLGMPNYADAIGRPTNFAPMTAEDVTNVTALLASWRQGKSDTGRGD